MQREAAAQQQRLRDAVALEAPGWQAELVAQRAARRQQVQPAAARRVDRHGRGPAEPEDRAATAPGSPGA
jgi:hypothetical protein